MKKYIIITILLISICTLSALNVPKLKGHINDEANLLSSREEGNLEQLLQNLETQTSAQMAVLIIPSLRGENLEDYSLQVAEAWGLGQRDRDNGVLLLISINDKKIRFEVGYGLESSFTDLKAGYIIRNTIAKEFQTGNFYEGIYQGVRTASGIVSGNSDISQEELAKYKQASKKTKSRGQIPVGLIVFLFIILSGGMRGRRGGLLTGLLLGNMLGGSGRSSGGFGGGGFGGFSGGGGGFGGGGASGGW